jgi:dolichyl-phosphate beta-glucosyltransferase
MSEDSVRGGPGRPEISVVLPCYGAAARAQESVGELSEFLDARALAWEIVVVDDGGGDFPLGAFEDSAAVRLVRLPANRGKGAAVRAGMAAARGEVQIFTDVDLPYDLNLLLVIREYISKRGFHVVVGDRTLPDSRYGSEVRWQRRLASRAFSWFVGKLVTGGFFDTQCGLKGFRGDVAQAIFPNTTLDGFAFDVEVIYLSLKSRLDIKRIPVHVRSAEDSSVRLLRDSSGMVLDVLRIKAQQMAGRYQSLESDLLFSRDFARLRDEVAKRP